VTDRNAIKLHLHRCVPAAFTAVPIGHKPTAETALTLPSAGSLARSDRSPGRAPPDVILIVFDCFSKHRVFSGTSSGISLPKRLI